MIPAGAGQAFVELPAGNNVKLTAVVTITLSPRCSDDSRSASNLPPAKEAPGPGRR